LARLVALLSSATKTVYVLAYSLTLDELGEALVAAQDRGVEIYVAMDESQAANQGGEFDRLVAAGVPVRLDNEGGLMHHKVMIIDEAIAVTGSYNFSANAERNNDENTLVIHNADLASEFIDEFWRIWDLSME
jgi:phosphatidylserine/phosphatidylglycerophosphate/cardiolipin synthase-like enzyme